MGRKCEGADQNAPSIVDNGCGFDAKQGTRGLGVLGMRDRVAAWGGQFTLNSDTSTALEPESLYVM